MLLRSGCRFAAMIVLAAMCAAQSAPNSQQSGGVSAPGSGNAGTGMNSPAITNAPALNNAVSSPAAASARPAGDRDPLLDLPPLPKGKIALQGGTLVQVDPVRNRLVMRPFGARKRQEVAFDVRTQFMRDGKNIQVRELRPGN